MSISEEKLAGVDQALADLGKTEEEVTEVRHRHAPSGPTDLQVVDADLAGLAEGASVSLPPVTVHTAETRVPEAANDVWEDEETEVEVLDESDFELLVDEDDLDELERVGEEAARVTTPPELPAEAGEEGDGFFKKLFGGRRSRPPQQ